MSSGEERLALFHFIRAAMRMESRSILIFHYVIIYLATSEPCPIIECNCIPAMTDPPMRMIMCENTNIRDVPNINPTNEIFHSISFVGCNIQRIEGDAFINVQTKQLDLSDNHLEYISNRAFTGLEHSLTQLTLQGDDKIGITFQAITNMTELTELNLKDFRLLHLDENTPLNKLLNLRYLALVNMHIEYVSAHTFKGRLLKLKQLDFVNNPGVSTFPVTAVNNLLSLEILNWKMNRMKTIPFNAFRNLSRLTVLDLSSNQIDHFETNCFKGITNTLEILTLSFNTRLSLTNTCSALSTSWPRLRILSFAYCEIQTIPNYCFTGMTGLTHLNLEGNKLTTVDSYLFKGLNSVIEIDLSENSITKIKEGVFSETNKIQTLRLGSQNNQDGQVCLDKACFVGVESSLKSIFLNRNRLAEHCLWDALRLLTNLETIDLSETGLHEIEDGLFANHRRIQYLFLSDNHISGIRRSQLRGLESSLVTLDLRNNFLRSIDKCVLKDFIRLELIFLASNPFHCDCRLAWLQDWIHDRKLENHTKANVMLSYVIQAMCNSPEHLKGMLVHEVDKGNFKCSGTENTSICSLEKENYLSNERKEGVNYKDILYGSTIVFLFTIILCLSLLFVRKHVTRKRQNILISYRANAMVTSNKGTTII